MVEFEVPEESSMVPYAEDEDVMFGTMDEHENHQEEQPLSESPNMRSFWGKDRVKKSSISAFSMGVIPRKKEDEK
jgi:hypothetical protein